MALEKQDLIEIKKIVNDVVSVAIEKSETKMSDKIEFAIEKSEMRMKKEIVGAVIESEEKIVEKLSDKIDREVADLSEINHQILSKIDKIDDHEKRIIKIEKRLVAGI
jgi:Mg2+ and Co2+ transporter CorA